MSLLSLFATEGTANSAGLIFPMSGQSLMAGQAGEGGTLPADEQLPDPGILTASYGVWPRPGQPLNYTAPVPAETFSVKPLWVDHTSWNLWDAALTGPEHRIMRDLKALLGRQLYLAKYAYGGLPISYWLQGGEMYKTIRRLIPDYENYMLNEAGYESVRYPFFTWFQGESDAILGRTTEQYASDLKFMRDDFRSQSKYTAGTPFIFRALSTAQTAITDAQPNGITNINNAFLQVCAEDPTCHLFYNDSLGLPTLSDKTHYSLVDLQKIAALVVPIAQANGYL